MRILALTRYGPLGASSRVRTFQYLPNLRSADVHVDVAPLLDDGYLERRYAGESSGLRFYLTTYLARVATLTRVRRYDLAWIEKELLPWVPGLVERGLLAGVPYVVDYDDATFHTYDQHPRSLVRRCMGLKIDRVMRGAALVVAGNDYLAERARKSGAVQVEVVPSVVDLRRYGQVTHLPEKPFTVGWIGSPGSEWLLDSIRNVLAEIGSHADTCMVLVGARGRSLQGLKVETRAWDLATEIDEVRQFHVGIMPLYDTPWTRGKCGYKLIQYMAAGRPVVASPVGVNSKIVQDGVSGFLASTSTEWLEAIETLKNDRSLARQMGLAGREIVEQRYDLAVTTPRLVDLLFLALRK